MSQKGAFIGIGSVLHKVTKDTGSFHLSPTYFIHNLAFTLMCAPHDHKVSAEAPDILPTFMGIWRKGTVSAVPVTPIRPSKKSPRICPPTSNEWNRSIPAFMVFTI